MVRIRAARSSCEDRRNRCAGSRALCANDLRRVLSFYPGVKKVQLQDGDDMLPVDTCFETNLAGFRSTTSEAGRRRQPAGNASRQQLAGMPAARRGLCCCTRRFCRNLHRRRHAQLFYRTQPQACTDHLGFVSHCTNTIVHSTDDLSVIQTRETLLFITGWVRAIYGDKPYRSTPRPLP